MVCLTLLFVVILTTVSKVISLHCTDQQLPQQLPASGDDDLQQVTTLHYCKSANCTIIILDTGEKLDIVYTTDSLTVTPPMGGHTSVMIAKDERAFDCNGHQLHVVELVLLMICLSITMVVSGLIVALTTMLKDLCTLFGYLLMLYNIATVLYCGYTVNGVSCRS